VTDRLRVVCMVAYTEYPTDARIRRESETLAAHGFRVICLANRMGPAPRRYELDGVEVQELSVPKYRGKSGRAYLASYLRFLGAASMACVNLARRDELDVVHAHNLPDFLSFAGLVPRMLGRKVVLDVHDSIPETFTTKFSASRTGWRLLCAEERISAAVAHRVVCVNHPQRDTLVGRGISGNKTFVSMNVPDERIFSPVARAVPPTPGSLDLVYHGTMANRLGVDLVIRAVALLKSRIPGLRLHLWGQGDDLEAFQTLARDLDVTDRVEFSGRMLPLHELPARLASMDVGVVGNRQSVAGDLMLPVKLLEYVALGIPTVVPRLKTIAHYFDEGMVTYFEPEDVPSLADAILLLHGNPEGRLAQARRAHRFLDEHGWHRQGPEFVSFYEHLLKGQPS
jgi:glycosyltransferase involved in cell wall biosynthesis